MNMQRHLRIVAITLGIVLAVVSMNPALAQKSKTGKMGQSKADKTMTKAGNTLYDRLGGMKGIEDLADHFVSVLYTPMTGTSTAATTGTMGSTTGTMSHDGMGATGTATTTGTVDHDGAAGTMHKTGTTGNTKNPGTANKTGTSATGRNESMGTGRVKESGVSRDTLRGEHTGTMGTTTTNEATGTYGTTTKTGTMSGRAATGTTGAEVNNADPRGLVRNYVAARICVVAGGNCQEPSVPLNTFRDRINASSDQWVYAMNDLRSTLDQRNIPKSDQEEVMTSLTMLVHQASGADMGTSTTGTSTSTGTMRGTAGTGMGTGTNMNHDTTGMRMNRDTTGTTRGRGY